MNKYINFLISKIVKKKNEVGNHHQLTRLFYGLNDLKSKIDDMVIFSNYFSPIDPSFPKKKCICIKEFDLGHFIFIEGQICEYTIDNGRILRIYNIYHNDENWNIFEQVFQEHFLDLRERNLNIILKQNEI